MPAALQHPQQRLVELLLMIWKIFKGIFCPLESHQQGAALQAWERWQRLQQANESLKHSRPPPDDPALPGREQLKSGQAISIRWRLRARLAQQAFYSSAVAAELRAFFCRSAQ